MDSIAEIAEYGLAISKIIFQIMNECNIRLKSTYTSVIEFVDGTRISFWSIQSGKQDYLLRCSVAPGNLPLELAKKFVLHLLSNRICWKLFVNDKPTFATPFSFPDLGRERGVARGGFYSCSLCLFSRRSYYLRDWQRLTGTKNGFIGLHISDPVHTLF